MSRKIKVLVVDDSAIVRRILSECIATETDMEVVGTASDPYVARDKILMLHPDVITLDIEMPRMDGLTFLKRLMRHYPIPTIIISSLGQAACSAALEALRCGAVEVLAKPAGPYSVGDLRHSLALKIRTAATAVPRPVVTPSAAGTAGPKKLTPVCCNYVSGTVIAIGASTGGTVAIQDIFLGLPANTPGLVVTQHIPAEFSRAFADRLNRLCAIEVREAVTGDIVRPGLALIAPGNYHMLLRRSGSQFAVELQQGPEVCYQRPSVDVMFTSVAQTVGAQAVGVLLTGMGSDGARGMLSLKRAGALTIAQDEASCVVYGMPREATRLGGVCKVAALSQISGMLTGVLHQPSGP